MPALILIAFGLAFVTMTLTPVQAVAEDQAGVGSALVKLSLADF